MKPLFYVLVEESYNGVGASLFNPIVVHVRASNHDRAIEVAKEYLSTDCSYADEDIAQFDYTCGEVRSEDVLKG